MNGSGKPVVGNTPVTTPRLTKTCNVMSTVNPEARKKPNASGAIRAMRIPLHARTIKRLKTATDPKNPSSSPMTAKTKSV